MAVYVGAKKRKEWPNRWERVELLKRQEEEEENEEQSYKRGQIPRPQIQ